MSTFSVLSEFLYRLVTVILSLTMTCIQCRKMESKCKPRDLNVEEKPRIFEKFLRAIENESGLIQGSPKTWNVAVTIVQVT